MTTLVRSVVIGLLVLTGWRVHDLRAYFSGQEPEQARVARLQARLDAIPLRIEGMGAAAQSSRLSEEIIDRSGAHAHVMLHFTPTGGGSHVLYVGSALFLKGYFHAPKGCMSSRGWDVQEDTTVPFDAYPVASEEPRMRRLLLRRGLEQLLVYYWFQSAGRVGDDVGATHYFRFFDLLRNEPAKPVHIVSVYTSVERGEVEAAEARARRFLDAMASHLRAAID